MKSLTETQKAYLAGLIDGEGCLTITKQQPIGMQRTPVYSARLVVSMTNKEVIEHIQSMTGAGKVFYQGKKPKESDCASYQWTVYNAAELCQILRDITPYLIVKQNEATVLFEYMSLPKAHVPGKKPVPACYVKQRDAYYQRLRDLKTSGKGIREDRPMIELPEMENPQMTFEF